MRHSHFQRKCPKGLGCFPTSLHEKCFEHSHAPLATIDQGAKTASPKCCILYEPTAALDPIAEAEIYAKFSEISGDRTAIYISHRSSSCKFCDEIAVFHEGAVIQQGTHEALVADEDGKHHALWHAQTQYYTV